MIVIALTPKAGREGNPEVWGIVSMVMPSMIGGNGSCTHSHTYTHRNMHTYAYNYLPSLLSLIKFPLLVNEENFNKLRQFSTCLVYCNSGIYAHRCMYTYTYMHPCCGYALQTFRSATMYFGEVRSWSLTQLQRDLPLNMRMTRTTATTHFYYNEHKEERQLYSPFPLVLCQCCKYGRLTGFSETCYIKIKRFLSKLVADS